MQEVHKLQQKDAGLQLTISYREDGKLPEEEKEARKLVMESQTYEILEGVLHHEHPTDPKKWCMVVPTEERPKLLKESHSGKFSGHFAERKMYSTLRQRYWWKGMRSDVRHHCRSCLTCATRKGTGRPSQPPLQPIQVGGPFRHVGVDVLQLPLTESGNKYAVVFQDYLTKWVEAFAVPNQTAETIAKLLVEEIFCRHGAPEHLLSDRGANFLSDLVQEVCRLLNVTKVNTSGYHPQTDGLVEKFNSTLINMISKCCQKSKDWDKQLPYLLFAYRANIQQSTKESPFFLLYGRDPRMPSDSALNCASTPYMVDLDDYKSELTCNLSDAWTMAKESIQEAQVHQKTSIRQTQQRVYRLVVGDRVMVYMPQSVTGKAWKLARPFYGPYCILSHPQISAEVRLIDKPDSDSIFVALNSTTLLSRAT